MELTYSARTDTGRKRPHNEDNFATVISQDGSTVFFLVADGMGGHKAGEVASGKMVDIFTRKMTKADASSMTEKQLGDLMAKAIKEADQKVFRDTISHPERQGMGTTAVACAVRGDRIIAANVGDSRAYLSTKSNLTRITTDHSYVEELVQNGIITPEEARTHPDRNMITRAVGFLDDGKADIFTVDFPKNGVILLCSDGLYGMVEDEKLQRLIRRNKNMDKLSFRLLDEANKNGGADNITIIVARRHSEVI